MYDATISVAISQTSLFAGDASVVLTPTVYGTASVGSVWRYDIIGFSTYSWLSDPAAGLGLGGEAGQILEGAFSAVSTPHFAIKASFESSRQDLHNTHLSTGLRSQMFS